MTSRLLAGQVDVSVVVPAYQRADTVGRAVLSALTQTRRPLEVVVVDDGSTDGTGDVAEALGARVLRQPNQGVSAARNAGLAAARGSWVALLDSDDLWLPRHLETLTAHTEDHVLVGSHARAVPSGRLIGRPAPAPTRLGPRDAVWPEMPVSPTATLLRRDVAQDVGGFPAFGLAEDLDLWIRVLERGAGLLVPEVTCVYVEHEGQATSAAAAVRDSRRRVVEAYRDRPWWDEGLLTAVDTAAAWDELRARQARGERAGAAADALRLLSSGASRRALVQTLRHRAACRAG